MSGDKLNLKSLYIGSSPPTNPVDGMVWVDVSSTPYLVKVYRNGVWDVARGAGVDRVTAPAAFTSDYATPSSASASSEVSHEYASGSVGQGVNHLTWYAHWKASFYAYGRVWVLWQPNVGSGPLRIYNSADLVNWSNLVEIDTVADTIPWDSWFDGTYLHICYVWYDGTSTYYLCYRRCTPNADGTLTLGTRYLIQGYTSNSLAVPPRICVDEQGYVWIICRSTAGFQYGAGVYVFKNAVNDGGWTTASGYPMYLWLGGAYFATIGSVGSGGRMIAICGDTSTSPAKLKARHFNGAGWEGEVELGSLYEGEQGFTTPILGQDGLIHILFRAYSPSYVHHVTYNPASNSWSTPINLGFTGYFSLFRDHRSIIASYIANAPYNPGSNSLFIRRYSDGAWLPPLEYLLGGANYHQNLYQASPGDKATYLWLYASSAPYPLQAAYFKQMYPAKDSIDEFASTGWKPSTPQNSWITWDLGSTLAGVAGCRILWPNDATLRPQAYRLQASEDNVNWITLASYTQAPEAGWREYSWMPLNRCRYIRLTIDTPGTSGVMLQEFDYYQSSIWRHGHRGD